jgi:hypothetical protein
MMTYYFTPEQIRAMLGDDADGSGSPKDLGMPGSGLAASASTGTNTRPPSVDVGTETRTRAASSSTATGSGEGSSLSRAYTNVRAARNSLATVRPLYGSEVVIKNDLGTFNNEMDGQVALANYRLQTTLCSLRRPKANA